MGNEEQNPQTPISRWNTPTPLNVECAQGARNSEAIANLRHRQNTQEKKTDWLIYLVITTLVAVLSNLLFNIVNNGNNGCIDVILTALHLK